MMQAIFQMLHGVGFAPTLQSSYTQGEYPLALGFKPLPNVSAKRLPAPAIQFTPPATILGVPTPALGQTEKNQSEEHPGEAVVNDREQTPPTRAQGGRTRDRFGRSKQNDESKASKASSSGPRIRPGDLCSNRAKNLVLHRLGRGRRNVAGVKSHRRVVVRLYLRCKCRLRQMMTGTLHPCSGQCNALEVLQEPLLQFHQLVRVT
jgi:hypothetical protein